MRNGVYRAWIKGLGLSISGVAAFKDGELFAADRHFAYNGHSCERGGWLTATVMVKRLYASDPSSPFAGFDQLSVSLQGRAGHEFAQLIGQVDEASGAELSVELAFLCEA